MTEYFIGGEKTVFYYKTNLILSQFFRFKSFLFSFERVVNNMHLLVDWTCTKLWCFPDCSLLPPFFHFVLQKLYISQTIFSFSSQDNIWLLIKDFAFWSWQALDELHFEYVHLSHILLTKPLLVLIEVKVFDIVGVRFLFHFYYRFLLKSKTSENPWKFFLEK